MKRPICWRCGSSSPPRHRLTDRLQLAREVADAERLLHPLRELAFLERALHALDAGLRGSVA